MRRERNGQFRGRRDGTAQLYKSGIDRRFTPSKPNAKTAGSVQFSRPPQYVLFQETRTMFRRIAKRACKIARVCQCDRGKTRGNGPLRLRDFVLVQKQIEPADTIKEVDAAA